MAVRTYSGARKPWLPHRVTVYRPGAKSIYGGVATYEVAFDGVSAKITKRAGIFEPELRSIGSVPEEYIEFLLGAEEVPGFALGWQIQFGGVNYMVYDLTMPPDHRGNVHMIAGKAKVARQQSAG